MMVHIFIVHGVDPLFEIGGQHASNIEMILTIIPDLYLIEQGLVPLESHLVWWMPFKNL
jgi:hypothetical protein